MSKAMKPLEKHDPKEALIAFLKDVRDDLRAEWTKKVISRGYSENESSEAVTTAYNTIYDTMIACFEIRDREKLRQRAVAEVKCCASEKEGEEQSIISATTLRDVIEGRLLERFAGAQLRAVFSVYLPITNNIISSIALEQLRAVRCHLEDEQRAIRELSTPVLQISPGLLMIPIIGLLDSFRIRQLTEALLEAVMANRAEVTVIDLTGVSVMDSQVANHLIQTADAVRLMGAKVFFTGVSSETAQILVHIGIDLSKVNVRGDLQDGIEAGARKIRDTPRRQSEAA